MSLFEERYAFIPALQDYLPDWKNAEAYNFIEMTPQLWAWQFLRRNSRYRNLWGMFFYDAIAEIGDPSVISNIHANFENNRFSGFVTSQPSLEKIRRSAEIVADLFSLECFPPSPQNDRPPIRFKRMAKKEHALEISFNLYDPIEVNIKRLKEIIKETKAELMITDTRLRPNKYANYLRIFDAGLHYCSDDHEIAAVIYSTNENSYSAGYPASDLVRKQRETAKQLVNTGYRAIAQKI